MADKIDSVNAKLTGNEHAKRANAALSHGMETFLFGCLSLPMECCFACCCPCVVEAFTRSRLDGRACTPVDALCLSSPYANRQTLRAKYDVGYAEIPDCLAAACCGVCFTVQTARELALKMGDEPVFLSAAIKTNLIGDRGGDNDSAAPATTTAAAATTDVKVDSIEEEGKSSEPGNM